MLSLFPFSRIMLRYALLQIPNSVPHSALGLCFPSTSSLHSHSQPQSLDEAVDSFTHMLFMCCPPSILQFPKILGSLAKTNHCPTAISLFQQLQSRIFKSDFQPYTITLTTIIKALCLCGNAEKALHFHGKVLAHGFHY
ncbi:Putative pentatricopeptide repeat-containing protein [Arachis hypogaea]|nr:Putative pentatricopeptide repeat-containing protein [Arachis hypogaea]